MTDDFHSLTDRLGRVHRADSGDQTGSGRLIATSEKVVLEYLPDDSDEPAADASGEERELPASVRWGG